MRKEHLYESITEKYAELKQALNGTDIERIRTLTLEVHAMVHPAEISGKKEKTIADYVWDYMISGNQNVIVPREEGYVDLHYAGTNTVPVCWQFWHTYRIEDLVSNILMMDQNQIFNTEWQQKIGVSISDTGNALEFDEVVAFGKEMNAEALYEYMIAVGKNTRRILENLTLEQIQSMVPESRVMKILECLLYNKSTESCKTKLEKVASPFWRKLQKLSGTGLRLLVAPKYELKRLIAGIQLIH